LLVAALTNWRSRKWAWLALLLALLWPPFAWGAARGLIVRVDLPHADALVVLAGSSAYVERTRLAAKLFREGHAPIILLTNDNQQGGWSPSEQRNLLFVERAITELVSAGVPRSAIEVLPQQVGSTYDEALALREHATAHNLKALLVVTSGYHSRRALWTLRRILRESNISVGIEPVPPGEQTPVARSWWLYPRGWQLVSGEYLKLGYYFLEYR
jgi:uncharacterized SAM-binding protein YcdF (DUF218 family)